MTFCAESIEHKHCLDSKKYSTPEPRDMAVLAAPHMMGFAELALLAAVFAYEMEIIAAPFFAG